MYNRRKIGYSRITETIFYASLYFYVFREACSMEGITHSISTTPIGEGTTERDEDEEEIGTVPMTEQVMDPDIRITDTPDVDEPSEDRDPDWDKNKVIRDVAYYIRAHKFQDYDRRYYKKPEQSRSKLYEEFPKPPLRSLHWEVRKYCDASFVECLKYLEGMIKQTALRREDDTVTIMKEQKWNLVNNTKQIQTAQRDCQMAQRRDEIFVLPFQGPIGKYQWSPRDLSNQKRKLMIDSPGKDTTEETFHLSTVLNWILLYSWRTTVSYYMCWYTMRGVAELSIFGERCDNHANCQAEHGDGNGDPRADDTSPYACALYSFCPDHCCPMKHIRDMTDCYQSPHNPCYAENPPAEKRTCTLNRQENQDFFSLVANQINISCECLESGYEWSSRFGLCVDVNECVDGEHSCSQDNGETCMNMPGSYECVCKVGYIYDPERGECIFSPEMHELLAPEKAETNVTESKSILQMIVKAIAKSSDSCLKIDYRVLSATVLVHSLLIAKISR